MKNEKLKIDTTMLQNEFMEKCGLGEKTAAKEYPTANLVYMSMPDSMCRDNNQFCELYKEARKCDPAMTIINGLAAELRILNCHKASLQQKLKEATAQLDQAQVIAEQLRDEQERKHREEMKKIAISLITFADRECDSPAASAHHRLMARQIMGDDREYYSAILLHGCPDQQDMQEIAKFIRNN